MTEIPKAYEPQSVEEKWYDFWLEHQCFTADPARVSATRPAYSIVIPPPNVTGVLTLGHVLNNTIQDILARKARMDGKEVLWLPGTDHAGIATQNVVEKTLKKAGEIKHRDDLGREALVARIWEWKEKYGGIILKQLRALGASCDWTRTRFTMDPEYSSCVQKVFVDLYKKGLIYRGKRMVNWCPASLTALSDEEVVMKEQKGFMYHFRVEVVELVAQPPSAGSVVGQTPSSASVQQAPPPVGNLSATEVGSAGGGARSTDTGEGACATSQTVIRATGIFLTIATTRPETIPADTAVAVNPKDPRYQHLIGKHVIKALPLDVPKEQRIIPIISDDHVAFDFGTGVLKVTPAHDKADFEIGLRHKLPVIDVLTPDGKMTAEAGADLAGLDRFVARKKAMELMEAAGSLEKAEPYTNNVGFSERADVPIEPRLSEQWFLKYPSVEASKACVAQPGSAEHPLGMNGEAASGRADARRSGEMRFFPDRWAKVYDHWMGGIQDWCISRQLWWGHRIPVWSLRFKGAEFRANKSAAELVEFHCNAAGCSAPDNQVESLISFKRDAFEKWPGGIAWSDHVTSLRELGNGEFEFRVLTESDDVAKRLDSAGFTQDPDVLDTWFSSWLWPFATMGWTGDKDTDAKNPTLKAFYPTTDLVTGPDIIFFWVARMIMAGYEWMGDLPFRNVYFTGIIRDKQGRKMSKSLGNSPDPLDLIAKYGADALRFGVMRAAPLGQDVLFDEQTVELGRNFCNKLWNACRFRQMQSLGAQPPSAGVEVGQAPSPASVQPAPSPVESAGGGARSTDPGEGACATKAGDDVAGEIDPLLLTSDDKWILLRLDQAVREVTQALADYKFSDATAALYRFFWSEYCDWYVEASKAAFYGTDEKLKVNKLAVIDFVLGHQLRLFHPFLPFITEELWHGMGFSKDMPENQGGKTIMFATWPKVFTDEEKTYFQLDDAADKVAQAKYDLVSLGRGLRRDCKIDPAKKVKFVLRPAGELPPNETEVLKLLLNAETMELVGAAWSPDKGTPSAGNSLGDLFLPLAGLVDYAAERERLTKELEKIRSEIEKVQSKLGNPAFTEKVPAKVLDEHKQRLLDWQMKEKQTLASIENLPA